MILNACVRDDKMVDENICKTCDDKSCTHAGQPTTRERLDQESSGMKRYRVIVTEVQRGFVDVDAMSREDAATLALDQYEAGNVFWTQSGVTDTTAEEV